MRVTVDIKPGMVFPVGQRWKFSVMISDERLESTPSFDKVGMAKQAMRQMVDKLKGR